MGLRLQIDSSRSLSAGQVTKVELAQGRLSIGRGPGNDWVLADPNRYISSHHCFIEAEAGQYYITDISTNGTSLNRVENLLGKGQKIPLSPGDRLFIGDYEIQVSIDLVEDLEKPTDVPSLAETYSGRVSPPYAPIEAGTVHPLSGDSVAGTRPPAGDREGYTAALGAFLAGAGIPELKIPPEQVEWLLHQAGCLLRVFTSGTLEVLRARSQFKGELRIAQARYQPLEHNPLKFSVDLEDTLGILLTGKKGYQPSLEAVHEGFEEIKAHQTAMVAGMQGMLATLLRHIDPGLIEAENGHPGLLGGMLPAQKKALCWDRFKKTFEVMTWQREDILQGFFGAAFARAYEDQIERLAAHQEPTNRGQGE